MEGLQTVYCSSHQRQATSKCSVCNQWLCSRCTQSHKAKSHLVKGLSQLSEDWDSKLRSWIKGLEGQLESLGEDDRNSRMLKGLEIVELCKQEVIQVVEHHFQQLKLQYVSVIEATYQNSPEKQLLGFIRGKISQYSMLVSRLQASCGVVCSLQEDMLSNEYEVVLQFVQSKQRQCRAKANGDLNLVFNSESLSRIGDLLTQMIGVGAQKTTRQNCMPNDRRPSKESLLGHFLQKTSNLYLYNVPQAKGYKLQFLDFVVPLKSKSCITSSAKILLIGGESNSNGGTKYHKEIWQLDRKYNMMKILVLMRDARVFHSVTLATHQNQECLYVLGGKNASRLSSLQRLNITTNILTTMAPYKHALGGQSGIQYNDSIYYFGGLVNNQVNQQVIVYSICNNIWLDYLPVNPINYLPVLEPVVYRTGTGIIVLGGWRKYGSSGYTTNYIQTYNPNTNIFKTSTALLPQGVFRASSCAIQGQLLYLTVQTKRESNSYGPNMPQIMMIDPLRGRYQMTGFAQS